MLSCPASSLRHISCRAEGPHTGPHTSADEASTSREQICNRPLRYRVIECCTKSMQFTAPTTPTVSGMPACLAFTITSPCSRPPGSLPLSPSHTTRSSSLCRRVESWVPHRDSSVCARWTRVPKCGARPGTRIRLWWLRARRICSFRCLLFAVSAAAGLRNEDQGQGFRLRLDLIKRRIAL